VKKGKEQVWGRGGGSNIEGKNSTLIPGGPGTGVTRKWGGIKLVCEKKRQALGKKGKVMSGAA